MGEQRARELLKSFRFTKPGIALVHRNQYNDMLQLQVNEFARDIISGIEQWLTDIAGDAEKQAKLAELMEIYDANSYKVFQEERAKRSAPLIKSLCNKRE